MRRKARSEKNRAIPEMTLAFFFLGLVIHASGLWAQETAVPAELQLKLFLKILSFDRNLPSRAGDEIVFGVVYQSAYRASKNAQEDFLRAAAESDERDIGGIPVRCLAIDLHGKATLEESVLGNEVDVLYVAPLRAFDVKTISTICQQKKILTVTGVPEYARFDIAVSIDAKAGKPEIVINLPAARAGGSDFSSKLLNLATVITEKGGAE